ncbi:hypothetical protein BJ508DRAFT_325859 [Ascobolus immersus RN42]|uniref:Uncharacterized protein n=1 Tax=Ascobolus immersus RN42 TaxID=1160509 RepID=A0A3N4I7M3_ASCIM|nr:hypothetical protein BJ508DRAFT_325859 [Ascobolus immersus RN42]
MPAATVAKVRGSGLAGLGLSFAQVRLITWKMSKIGVGTEMAHLNAVMRHGLESFANTCISSRMLMHLPRMHILLFNRSDQSFKFTSLILQRFDMPITPIGLAQQWSMSAFLEAAIIDPIKAS